MSWSSFPKQVGDLSIHKSDDGGVSVSYREMWINAMFESEEAALSWADDLDGAERHFKEINAGLEVRSRNVGIRVPPDPTADVYVDVISGKDGTTRLPLKTRQRAAGMSIAPSVLYDSNPLNCVPVIYVRGQYKPHGE